MMISYGWCFLNYTQLSISQSFEVEFLLQAGADETDFLMVHGKCINAETGSWKVYKAQKFLPEVFDGFLCVPVLGQKNSGLQT
jgi:hypothetical protein